MEGLHSLLPTDSVVLDDIDDEFHAAIQHLKKQDTIGLALEEPECDRFGDLEWLSVSSSMCTFIFDIQKLQKNAFREGLKAVLEDPRIVKILHDCRRPSDCLYHQYDTKLNNVFDTQVADFVTNVQNTSLLNITRSVNSLYCCLSSYLQITEEFFNPRPIKSDFSLRPIKPHLKDYIIRNVIYLRLLKKELDVTLRIPYRRCVDIYMQSVLRRSDGEMKLCPPELATVPPEMLIEGMQVFKITDQLPKSGAFVQKKDMKDKYQLQYKESDCADLDKNHLSREFDRTEVIKFLIERMFYGGNLNNDIISHSVKSDQYSVKSTDDVSSLSDSVPSAEKSKNAEINISTLPELKRLSTTTSCQNDSKLLSFESLGASDTSSKGRSEKSLAMSKTIDLVRHLKLKPASQSIDDKSKQSNDNSLVESIGNSAFYNQRPEQLNVLDETHQSKEVNNNLVSTPKVLECLDGKDLISIVTSKDISPLETYKFVMSNRSKTNSKTSSISGSSGHASSKHSEKSSNYISNASKPERSSECFDCVLSCDSDGLKQGIDSSEVMMKEDVAGYKKSSSSNEPDNVPNVIEDPWEKLKSAFDDLGPQRPINRSLFVPAGMNC